MTFRHILFCVSALFLAFPVLAEEKTYSETSPVRHAVILDTDMGNDVDDALALAMLYRYVDEGKADLLGVMVKNCRQPWLSIADCLPDNRIIL